MKPCTFISRYSVLLQPMETTRQLKFARLIQKEMAEIFQTETRGTFGSVMITVTQVRMSPDLGVAKIYVSLFPVKEKDKYMALIRDHTSELRKSLGGRIRHQVRIVPELIFYLDDSLDYAEHIEQLLKK
jgi:ribosome-binding factor A